MSNNTWYKLVDEAHELYANSPGSIELDEIFKIFRDPSFDKAIREKATRAASALRRRGIRNKAALEKLSKTEIIHIRNVGATTANLINAIKNGRHSEAIYPTVQNSPILRDIISTIGLVRAEEILLSNLSKDEIVEMLSRGKKKEDLIKMLLNEEQETDDEQQHTETEDH